MSNNFDEFKNYIRDKSVTVVGIGVSNIPLIKKLVELNARVTACDKREDIGDLQGEFLELGVKVKLGENYLDSIFDSEIVFRTPSLLPNNEYLVKAKDMGIVITSEISEFMKYCPCKIFGVTGSDGKTTTTTIIGEMLKKQGYRVHVGGNIGTPLFSQLDNIEKDDLVVLELSSFQLMDMENSPEVSAITNLSPNHLDYHKDMDEYIEAKKNIFKYQKNNNMLILNFDNAITRQMDKEAKGIVRFFSLYNQMAYAYIREDIMIVNNNEVCSINDIKIPGMHNVENLLTAFSAVGDFVSIETMKFIATNFKGVEHRIEFVRELHGVKFYNGSIASSPTRTLADLKAFNKKVILIAGGYDKNIPFDELAAEGIDRIKLLVLMGNTKVKIREAFEQVIKTRGVTLDIFEADSLEAAVKKAYNTAEEGDIITMSPGCASFDMFKNFEVRGKVFKEIVNNL